MEEDVVGPMPLAGQQLRRPSRRMTLSRVFSSLTIKSPKNESPEDVRGPLGLGLLFDSAQPMADLVFVHGLGGGSRKTWDKNNDPQLFWPREWLSRDPEFKHVRVHTFGYPADWTDRQESILDISDFANQLLSQLQASPTIRRGKPVPLVFVCHSMGGLVVKRAYILSQMDPAFQSLGKRFDTIYFLATPHNGANSAHLLSAMIKATHIGNKPFVSALRLNSTAIQAINDEFRHFSSKVQLYSFFETRATSVAGLGDTLIVPKSSAMLKLPNERVSPLQSDHRGVCKYDSPEDPNYMIVRDSIVEALDRITETWNSMNEATRKSQKHSLRCFLRLSDHLRHFHVDFDEPRVEGSCEWLADVPLFRQWRDAEEPRIFWLYGNPGVGKSFLAKYVIDHVVSLGFDCSYFFFRAGDKGYSTLRGCLLSLAWQMAESNAFVRDTFLEMSESETGFDQDNFQSIWRTLFISGIFQTKRLVKPQFWVLDGLDECSNHIELFPLLAKISSTFRLKIFLSSRPSPDISGSLASNSLSATTYALTQEATWQDVKRYLENHVDFPSMQNDAQRKELISLILKKSEGSFLWVKLVLKELRGAFSEEATRKVLEAVPKGMDQIYLRSLDILAKEEARQPTAKAILMWSSTCVRPLSVTELRAALITHIQQTFNNLEMHISWLCGHLVTVDSNSHVKMVHETARSFVLNPNNGSAIAFTEEQAHEALAMVCLRYLNDKELKAPRGRRSHPNTKEAAQAPRSPLLKYAAVAWHEHVEKSKSTSGEMVRLLSTFCSTQNGNILSWIEHVAATNSDLTIVTRAGVAMRGFAIRIGKSHLQTEELEVIRSWSADLLRVVAKFGRNLLRFPASIYAMIPPLCPRNSAIYRQFGHAQRSLNLVGVPSLRDWDDCLATIVYKQKGNRAMSVAAMSNCFAVGMSTPFVRLYHTNSCQEFAAFHHGESAKVVEFSLAGNYMATAGNKRLCVWDIAKRELVWEYELKRPCMAMTFNADNDELIVACQNNHLYYFAVELGELTNDPIEWFMDENQVYNITHVPSTVAISFQHHLLAFVYRGSPIGLWNWETDEFVGLCEKPEARHRRCPFHASSLVFSPVPNSDSLAAAYEQGEILVFDPKNGNVKASYRAKTDNQTLATSPDGRTLVSGDSVGVIRIFDFQNFEPPDYKLRLLYILSGAEENIVSLAFCDDRRFVDIRSPRIKVWEPTILVRHDSGGDTESIMSENASNVDPVVEETDPITSLTVHPNNKHIFCATQNGLINIYDTVTGRCTQTIYEHSKGDTITWMIFSKAEDILASAGVSSKIAIHRLAYKNNSWTIEAKLFEYRMGERIEQLMFNPQGTKILVVTTTHDIVYSLADESTASAQWDTRLPGVWCNDPRDSSRLLLWVNCKLRVFMWEGLREITPPSGIGLDIDLPHGFGIHSVYSGWNGSYVATVYSEVGHVRSTLRFHIWDAEDFVIHADGSDVEISPCETHRQYGHWIADLVGTLGMVIGLFGTRVLFLDQDGWICSMVLAPATPETYSRHFFLPFDWLSTDDTLLVAFTARNEILFTKEDELAVIKRGLDFSQPVPLRNRSRRSSETA
ncbi:hypothetical protein QBC34DRAFT_182549 [Podospora aff. communis PSN243]|uniref:GPI inositol-deacylase n=1 Tax=Podospora aff. communis PSN243 TaxID=3040156 RepID=A0AAV9GAJ2_9PEZI|nr:hypothetical protein QBC34DRAFT_182549 [Podospora aff. communis PSN243]